ncbi:MAG TPA: radical SAM protein [Thermoplasmata archaeon]|nr:radical SAM protein [Thermoplasmata archaeon]
MNIYRGCHHNCVYCDGRAEGYYVEGEFGTDVSVKINAVDVLAQELDLRRKRTPLQPGYVMVGGGVGDSYQPVEEKYGLTRKTLTLLSEKKFPVHILTKSTLVSRDIDLLQKINETSKVIVSFSFSSTDESISRIFEPGVPSPQERLETMAFLKDQGLACGMFLMPVIPFITDTKEILHKTIHDAKDVGVDFIICGGMTLKDGKQKDYFLNILKKYYPDLLLEYQMIYKGSKWGEATSEYYHQLHQSFHTLMNLYKIPKRIPPALFKGILSQNDLIVVILEHLDYLLKLEGKKSPYGFAAYSLSNLQVPLSTIRYQLQSIKGIGSTTEKIIQEVLDTGSSQYYERLLKGDI